MNATLRGGPFDGAPVPLTSGRTILVGGDPLADHLLARYRWSRREQGYVFHEIDETALRNEAA